MREERAVVEAKPHQTLEAVEAVDDFRRLWVRRHELNALTAEHPKLEPAADGGRQ